MTRRPRIDAAAALRYSPRMAKKIYLRLRCVQLARVPKKTSSFYYHCDWHASHYVKVMLDHDFGGELKITIISECNCRAGARAAASFHLLQWPQVFLNWRIQTSQLGSRQFI